MFGEFEDTTLFILSMIFFLLLFSTDSKLLLTRFSSRVKPWTLLGSGLASMGCVSFVLRDRDVKNFAL